MATGREEFWLQKYQGAGWFCLLFTSTILCIKSGALGQGEQLIVFLWLCFSTGKREKRGKKPKKL